jgi:S-adenosylmethionine/arginine decarboxylase-like enzyme
MNELPAGDQPLLHGHFAPCAEAVGEIGGARFGGGIHGPALSMRVKNLVNRPPTPPSVKNFLLSHADERNRGIVQKNLQRFFTHTHRKADCPMSVPVGSEETILPSSAPAASSTIPIGQMVGEGKAWGLCTAVDLQDCHPDLIRNADHIRRYVIELCELIGMQRFGECQVVDFGSGRVAGYSMVQLISTSLISGHFANDTNNAYLDIFSCKGYDPAVVEEFSKRFFGARRSTATITLRH